MMTPRIDIHTHLFSALDIPIEGYLRSRRSEKRSLCDVEYLVNFFPGPQIFTYLADRMRERVVTRRMGSGRKGAFYRLLLWVFEKIMRQNFQVWEDSLTKTQDANARDLQATWPGVDLFVPLMIDYEYWFKNTMDTPIDRQIVRMAEHVVLPGGGRFHPFAPFDPVRELVHRKGLNNPDGQKETVSPMAWIKKAVRDMGFIGVKLYNSLGYRPAGNGDADMLLRRWRIGVRNEKMQYVFDGHEIDAVMDELFAWCEKEDVPVTAHCMDRGIEAYPGASEPFGGARRWRPVLDRHPGLRLNLAHFGWNPAPGIGYGAPGNWMREVCGMICEYGHVYADVAHHEVTSRAKRRELTEAYRTIQREFAADLDKIRKRILYASDWHVLRRIPNYESFMNRYAEILKQTEFCDDMDDFLGGNALRFLGLEKGGRNRKRLERFYAKSGRPVPAWLAG